MKTGQATAEVFFTAFKSLKSTERDAIIEKMVSDPHIREDLIEVALIEKAKKVKGRPVSAREYFSRNKKKVA